MSWQSSHRSANFKSYILKFCLAVGFVGAVALAERRRPLRRRVEPQGRRAGRNLVHAALSAGTIALLEAPVPALQRWAERRRIGLLNRLAFPEPLRTTAGILLLDYTLYIWHWLNHRVPVFWRFHLVHHIDLDLDASTGVRFHFGEMALSAGYRAAQVVALGVNAPALGIWQRALLASVVFHHSNLRLPLGIERSLARLLVTPRMHGIHHSIVERENGSNFSSLFACWDVVHGTQRLNVPQKAITIGLPAFQDPADVTLAKTVALPFEEQRPVWRLPDGSQPKRADSLARRSELLP